MSAELIREKIEIEARYGKWTTPIDFPFERRDRCLSNENTLHLVQLASDLIIGPLSKSRVLDLGCLEGEYALEFAKLGAQVLGIEGRHSNLIKAEFGKKALGLNNIEFHLDDIRNLSSAKYGTFEVVLCLGILYHLAAPDVFTLVERLSELCNRIVIIGTHISVSSSRQFEHNGKLYFGSDYIEPNYDTDTVGRAAWSAIGNPVSFWLDRSSLMNMLYDCGFSSVLDYNVPGGPYADRIILAAIKGEDRIAPPLRFSKGDLRFPSVLAERLKRKLVNLNHRLKQL